MIVEVIVEITAGSSYKYEICKETGELVLDRVIPIQIPFHYGYIPKTICGDGDPLDVFILASNYIPPKTRVKVELIGMFMCEDNLLSDDKVIGVLVGENSEISAEDMNGIKNLIHYYLTNYKSGFKVLGFKDALAAENTYKESKLEQDSRN